jgi:hypothetical protein
MICGEHARENAKKVAGLAVKIASNRESNRPFRGPSIFEDGYE